MIKRIFLFREVVSVPKIGNIVLKQIANLKSSIVNNIVPLRPNLFICHYLKILD